MDIAAAGRAGGDGGIMREGSFWYTVHDGFCVYFVNNFREEFLEVDSGLDMMARQVS